MAAQTTNAVTRADAVANVQAAIKACEATGSPGGGIDNIDLDADEKLLVLAMGYVSAARHDTVCTSHDRESLDRALDLLTELKEGIATTKGALVDAGVIVPEEKAEQ